MKHIFTNSMVFLMAAILILGFSSFDDKGKVHLKITKEENGETSVFEKSYENMTALKADQELKDFDVMIENWAKGEDTQAHTFNFFNNKDGKKVIIKKRMDSENDLTWVSEDGDDDEKEIIIKKKGDKDEIIEIKKGNKVKINTTDGEQTISMTFEKEGDGTMIWVDENGNKTELTDENINELIKKHQEDGEDIKVEKIIKVRTTDEGDGEHKVMIITDDEDKREIEVNIEKEIDENGEEKIVNKRVWVTKDGEKVELDNEGDYQIKTEGDKIEVIVDDEIIENADFSGGNIEGDTKTFTVTSSDEAPKQFMNVNIEEENGETFINIDIKREGALNVMISDIFKDDASLKDVTFSLKNNLNPSQLNYYPNPSNGKFNLKFNLDQQEEVTVKVMDILGNEVYKESILDFNGTYDNQLDLKGHEKGIYVLQIIQNKKVLSRKILIE